MGARGRMCRGLRARLPFLAGVRAHVYTGLVCCTLQFSTTGGAVLCTLIFSKHRCRAFVEHGKVQVPAPRPRKW